MQNGDPDQLRDDIVVLRTIVDAALDAGKNDGLLRAAAEILQERKKRLAELEQPEGLRDRYERALP